MKQTYTFIAFLLLSLSAFSQNTNFTLTFEDTTVINQVYYTDSTFDPAGIWQIGRPNKPLFDSAYNSPNAVVTGLDSAMPPGITASFVIGVTSYLWSHSPIGSLLIFTHKYDFDSAKGGGYIDYSVDSGGHWHPIVNQNRYQYLSDYDSCIGAEAMTVDGQYIFPPMWYSRLSLDTTALGDPYFTGTDTIWQTDTIVVPTFIPVAKTFVNSDLWIRYTAFSDTNSLYKQGWLIDNIQFREGAIRCYGGINEINSSHLSIYPDPVMNAFTISLTDEVSDEYSVTLYDLTGREMIQRSFIGREVTLRRDDLAAGSYVIRVRNKRTQDAFEKRVVFE